LLTVLLLLIPTVWLAVVFFAVAMFRLAAQSDDSQAVALAERIATIYRAERKAAPAERPADQLPVEAKQRLHRATGRS
jgi:hypothetical protein